MPRKNDKPESLLIVLRHRNDSLWREVLSRGWLFYDHVIYLVPQDLPQPGTEDLDDSSLSRNALRAFLAQISGSGQFDTVSIISGRGTSAQLEAILNELWPRLLPHCDLTVGGFHTTADQFRRLTGHCAALDFVFCTFGKDWWKSPGGDLSCAELLMDSCNGALPRNLKAGRAGWDSLRTIQVRGRERPLPLRRAGIYEDCLLPTRDYQTFAEDWIRSFWCPNLKDVSLFDLDSADCLTFLPPRPSLRSLLIDAGVTPPVLEWAVGNPNLVRLDLAWRPGCRLPWSALSKLKRLRSLGLEDTCLSDEELLEIAAHTRLRSISAYYTDLTPRSWHLILAWPGLKQFWGSQELAFESPPSGLPQSTALKEFVALNTKFSWFERFFSRYPNVRVVEM